MAATRDAARQIVLHGHIRMNDRRNNIPSFQIKPGDVITTKDAPKSRALLQRNLEDNTNRLVPDWVKVDAENLKGEVERLPKREEIQSIANEQLVVELYSK